MFTVDEKTKHLTSPLCIQHGQNTTHGHGQYSSASVKNNARGVDSFEASGSRGRGAVPSQHGTQKLVPPRAYGYFVIFSPLNGERKAKASTISQDARPTHLLEPIQGELAKESRHLKVRKMQWHHLVAWRGVAWPDHERSNEQAGVVRGTKCW